MCILPSTPTFVALNPAAPTCPARFLGPDQRQALAVAALAGTQPITHLAADYGVRRTFVYQQADQAEQALAEAFSPAPPTDDRILILVDLPVTEVWLHRLSVALLLVCHSSYRGVYELLRDLFHCERSLGYLHGGAHAAMDRARAHNGQHDLSRVAIGAHDEIFQTRQPVLVGVDGASTYCYLLSPEAHRDGDTWDLRLLELQTQGFAPRALIGAGGRGLVAGHELVLPQVPRRSDVFHVMHEILPAVTALENRAYQALTACVKLERQQAASERKQGRREASVSQKLRHARPAAEAAVVLADDVATLAGWWRQDVLAVAGPCHAERVALYDFIVAELRVRAPQCAHRLGPLGTYRANQRDTVLAVAAQLAADLAALAVDFQVSPAVVRAVLSVHEMNLRDPRRWPRAAALREHLRGRFYALSEAVAAVARGTVRASSVVENLNSRLRNYFFLRRHLGPDYLHLLQFFLNHRRFLRSEHPERVDHSPAACPLAGVAWPTGSRTQLNPDRRDPPRRRARRTRCLGEATDGPYCYPKKARFEPGRSPR